eukprot:g53038.t1
MDRRGTFFLCHVLLFLVVCFKPGKALISAFRGVFPGKGGWKSFVSGGKSASLLATDREKKSKEDLKFDFCQHLSTQLFL